MVSPFEGAKLGPVQAFVPSYSSKQGTCSCYAGVSTLLTLLEDYELRQEERSNSIFQKARGAIRTGRQPTDGSADR